MWNECNMDVLHLPCCHYHVIYHLLWRFIMGILYSRRAFISCILIIVVIMGLNECSQLSITSTKVSDTKKNG